MADTVDLDAIEEFHDSAAEQARKVKALADAIRASKHTVVFTGAGISTSAKIPDFRGPDGVWTRQAQGRAGPSSVSMEMAVPTYSHRGLKALVDSGDVKYVVSQNIDGLHRRSGIAGDKISELHGNCFKEVCWKDGCGKEYLRTYDTCGSTRNACRECRKRVPHFCHCTGRKCSCGSILKDSIIHFKENLPEVPLTRAYDECGKADLILVLGSSLRVSPACDLPREMRGGKLVIVNLQKTPQDRKCAIRMFSKIDEVFEQLMPLLGVEPAPIDPRAMGIEDESEDEGTPASASAAAGTESKASEGPSGAGSGTAEMLTTSSVAGSAGAAGATATTVVVGNTHMEVPAHGHDTNTHQWSVFARAYDASGAECSASSIDRVAFGLHPTFHPCTVEVSAPPFAVARVGWGTFDVKMTVYFKDEAMAPMELSHTLSFEGDGATSEHDVAAVAAATASAS